MAMYPGLIVTATGNSDSDFTSNTGNGFVDKGTLQTVNGHNQALYVVSNSLYGQVVP